MDVSYRSRLKIKELLDESGYRYCGKLNDVKFLSRIYKLSTLPSSDRRFLSAREDIAQHTSRANCVDWPLNWVLEDRRFNLLYCGEEEYKHFLLVMLDPDIRKYQLEQLIPQLNNILHFDGLEIYEKDIDHGDSIYGFRLYDRLKGWRPFSLREDSSQFKLLSGLDKPEFRTGMQDILLSLSERVYVTEETGWNSLQDNFSLMMNNLVRYGLIPGPCRFEDYVGTCEPIHLIDLLEMVILGEQCTHSYLELRVNHLFDCCGLPLKLLSEEVVWVEKGTYGNMDLHVPSEEPGYDSLFSKIEEMKSDLRNGRYYAAVTLSATCIDTLLKHMAKAAGREIGKGEKLQKLLRDVLEAYKQDISGNAGALVQTIASQLTTLVNTLSELRNKHSNAHGQSDENTEYTKEQVQLVCDATVAVCNYLSAIMNRYEKT